MKKYLGIFALMMAMLLLTSMTCGALAEDWKWDQRVEIMVPAGEGGGLDTTIRKFATYLEKELGTTITILNKSGTAGVTGYTWSYNSTNKGYSYQFTAPTVIISAAQGLFTGFDPMKVIKPVSGLVNAEGMIISRLNAPWKDAQELIDYAKAHPGEVQMGGSSNASVWHIAGGYLMNAADIELQMVTYQEGAATAVQNAASGFIQGVTVSLGEARNFIESGHLICLGVMDDQRNSLFPDVPTCKEQGYDIAYATQRGMAVPKGIDPAIKDRLQAACAAAIEDPDFVTFMNNGGYTIAYQNAEEYTAFLAQSLTDVGEAMESLGL